MDKKKLEHKIYSKLRKEKARLVSFSEASEYENCPHARYLHRVLKVDGQNNIYAVAGSLCHDLLERHYMEGLGKEQMAKDFEDGMVEIFKKGYNFATDKIGNSWLANMRLYYQGFQTDANIKSCEDFVAMPLWTHDSSLNGYYAQGWVDNIIENDDGTVSLGDFKSSTIYKGNDLLDKSKQLIIYSILYEYMYNKKVKSVFFDFLKYAEIEYKDVKGKIKKKIVERREMYLYDVLSFEKAYVFVELNEETKRNALEWFIRLIHEMENDVVFEKGKKCSSFFCRTLCGYRNSCKYFY